MQVEDDDQEVQVTKRPRYSPLPLTMSPTITGSLPLMSGHDEPSSSHCPSPGPGPSHQSQQAALNILLINTAELNLFLLKVLIF